MSNIQEAEKAVAVAEARFAAASVAREACRRRNFTAGSPRSPQAEANAVSEEYRQARQTLDAARYELLRAQYPVGTARFARETRARLARESESNRLFPGAA
jgi:hypothetical protein